MSGSDIRDILQIGSPTEPVQRKLKVTEKRPGSTRYSSTLLADQYVNTPCPH